MNSNHTTTGTKRLVRGTGPLCHASASQIADVCRAPYNNPMCAEKGKVCTTALHGVVPGTDLQVLAEGV